jgi:hypothetical protein
MHRCLDYAYAYDLDGLGLMLRCLVKKSHWTCK